MTKNEWIQYAHLTRLAYYMGLSQGTANAIYYGYYPDTLTGDKKHNAILTMLQYQHDARKNHGK